MDGGKYIHPQNEVVGGSETGDVRRDEVSRDLSQLYHKDSVEIRTMVPDYIF
jgi:coenzyme F420-reducing hydrogenase alpha subunit